MIAKRIVAAALVGATASWSLGDEAWRARVDAVLLSPTISGPRFQDVFAEVPTGVEFDGSFSNQLEGAYRLVAEKEHASGTGLRFQFFDFDNGVDYEGTWENGVSLQFEGLIDVEVYAFDAEATQRTTFRYWDLIIGGGLRAGGVDITQGGALYSSVSSFYGVPSGVDFDGVGPTLSLYGERALGDTGLSIVGRGRVSLLFGELEQTPTFGAATPPILSRTTDDIAQVTEIQFGLNYSRCLGPATGTFGVFWEAQRWDTDSERLGDLGLHGLSLQSGLAY